ncbi:translocation and assembly module TamB [Granulicella rosea]|uniref:Translocation and assembly module TamB n=1 Tax=Granulicella rosea TaxID=474952 RepID=A0A239E1H0_9BACT|nr:translocation/assembly module TamB domain-containing protein [Granulicella rosea]SNS38457.1 translocation and assembly module TamB [Granulicella rosea]
MIFDAKPTPESNEPEATPAAKKRRSFLNKLAHVTGLAVTSFVLLLLIALIGVSWYTTTDDFQKRVGAKVVSLLEDATGGRVELGHISLSLWSLAVEVDGLVIHGLEGPNEAPYLAAKRILVRVQLNNILQHAQGKGVGSPVGLNLLHVDDPHVHLIVDKDGKTNQPVPKTVTKSTKPVIDTLMDLRARHVELVDGVALLNDRAIPFNLTANDLDAEVHYVPPTSDKPERYVAMVDLSDLRTQMAKQPEAKSHLHLEAEVGRDMAALTKFDFHTGQDSDLTASASLDHFANPVWQAKLAGTLELKQISIMAAVDGLAAGTIDLNVAGHSCNTAPVVAQRHPRFWERSHPKAAAPSAKVLPPDPDCQAGYLLVGSAKLHNAAYVDQYVRFHDIDAGAQLNITPAELLFSALTASLPNGGGKVAGEMKIMNWLGEAPADTPTSSPTVAGAATTANKTAVAVGATPTASTTPSVPKVAPAHAYVTVTVDHIPLRTIMDDTAPKGYGDLGFDTSITGPVKVEWGGAVTDISDTVLVDADLDLTPTGIIRKTAYSNVPVSGKILGHYDGKREVVNIQKLDLQTRSTTLTANGVLGVNIGDPLTALQVDMNVRDFGEFDQLLRTLELTGANGTKGAAAIPAVLHGSATFHGTASGEIAKLDVKGHLVANNFEFKLVTPATPPPPEPKNMLAKMMKSSAPVAPPPPPSVIDVQIDSLVADAEYTPSALAVGSSTIKRGSAVLNVAGSFKPRVVMHRKTPEYFWDGGMQTDVTVKLANAQVVDVLQIAGQQEKVPVTGIVNVNAHAAGLLKTLAGGGNITLTNGVAYGEPYDSVSVDANVQGRQVEATKIALVMHGVGIAGNGGYNLDSEKVHAHLAGDNLVLSKFKTVATAMPDVDAVASLVADADGTLKEPGLKANVRLANATVEGRPIGEATVNAHSEKDLVYYDLTSTLVGAKIVANGQTSLAGDYQTQAKLTIAGLDIGTPLALFQPDGVKAKSNISGTITISGPAKTPTALVGSAQFDNFEITSQNITLKTAESLRIGLRNGLATLDQVHITGQDTDMRASGSAQVFGAVDAKTGKPDPMGGKLDVKALGSVSLALLHTFDPDITANGKMVFSVGAGNKVMDPALTGKIDFQNVNLAMDGIPNGLSNMNGTLVFNEDRLNVQNLVATTGGGQVKIGGFITYRKGLYADLNATADVVRVRYYGLSATANATLRLQGGPNSAVLSGNVLLTRFGVGADVDFAAFSSAGGVSAPPDPDAATNKIQLDVKITSSPQLDFQNSYAKLAGTVNLNIRGTIAEPTVLGRIQITDGSATFAGTQYQLQRGDIYFTNPVRIDPVIDLDATARVETYDVTVGLHGTASNFKPTYRSEPPLSEADIFALLALGRTQEEAQIYQEQQVQSGTDPTTSSLLGGALNATVSNRVSKLFGVGSVKIDPAFVGTLGNSSARITVQQQLSRQLTLTYATNVNSSAEQLISLQYQLNPSMSIVATRDETGVFSIVYKIRRRYR